MAFLPSCLERSSSALRASRRSMRFTTPRTTRGTPSASPATSAPGILMLQRIFGTALGAGIAVGLIVAILQHVTLVPLILEAEKYEDGKLTVQHKHSQALPTDIGAQVAIALPAVIATAQADDEKPGAKTEEESP